MRRCTYDFVRTATIAVATILGFFLTSSPALAQQTVVLNTRQQLTVDTTIRGGSYATTNFGADAVLETRASSDDQYERRALLKFDTADYIPAGAAIQSAVLTLTVKGGNSETRTLTAYRVTQSFDERAANWKNRKSSLTWTTNGASLSGKYATARATGTAGSKVSFDVTALVQDAVNGKFDSRYTRVGIVDDGASSRDSYRQFYSSETSTSSLRPTLTVVYGGTSSTSSSSTGTLPSGWSSKDIGSVGAGGSATSTSGSAFTVTGAGADVWGSADEFRFAYRTLSGDGTIVARVASEEAVDEWTKAGVMFRETLNAGSRHAFMLVSPGKGTALQRRTVTSGASASTSSSGRAPSWVKLVRSGSTFTGYRSADGVTWTKVGSTSIPMASTAYVGLAVSSHADPSLATATFDQVSVKAGATSTSTSSSSTTKTLRVVHWNTHHGGFGTDGKYDTDRLATWVAKLKPDVVSFNEIEKYTGWGNQDQPAVYKKLLEQKTGQTWYMVWAQEYGNWTANGKGNLILSRFPWTFTARYLTPHVRTVALGGISINGRNVTFSSTHLDPDSESYRLDQAKAVVPWELGFAENRIIVGDLNAQPTSSTLTYLKNTYTDGWLVAKSGGFAYSASDNPNGYTRNSRIDFVMTSKNASNVKLIRVEVVDTRDANGVMPSDHRPILAVYEVQ